MDLLDPTGSAACPRLPEPTPGGRVPRQAMPSATATPTAVRIAAPACRRFPVARLWHAGCTVSGMSRTPLHTEARLEAVA
ncbi:MAG TPA: hypothetical protein VIG88_04075 [Lysobacter sp.]